MTDASAWPGELIEVPVDHLRPYERNARRHSAEQVDRIARSIPEFGFNAPILTDGDLVIIAGHGRLLAARKLGLSKVPVRKLGHMTDEQRRAYTIADNRVAEPAEWDIDVLAAELDDLQALGVDAALTGFEGADLDEIMRHLETGAATDGEDDAPPAPAPDETVSRPGDLWICGAHRVVCGDATDPKAVTRLLGGEVPLLMVTDPPYGGSYDPSWRNEARIRGRVIGATAVGKILNDDRADWRSAWALFPGDVAYVWHAATRSETVLASLRHAGFEPRAQIVWVKARPVISRGDYHWQHESAAYAERVDEAAPKSADPALVYDHELAAYTVRAGRTGHWNGDRRQSTVWTIDHRKSETGHGTQKPVECMRRPMLNNSRKGDAVYDPFLGSGTTLVAAELSERRCLGLELDPAYADVTARRWQDMTKGSAVLEGDGRTFAEIAAERCPETAEVA